jgi:2-hydroxychromene-2-carboxylate isomerase
LSLVTRLRSRYVGLLLADGAASLRRRMAEVRRRLARQPHVVSAFLGLDDPYSYLLSQYLPNLREAFDVELRFYLTQACGEDYRPHPDLLAQYAERDCERLARELGVPFLDRGTAPPVEHRRALVETLAEIHERPEFGDELLRCLAQYWRGDGEAVSRRCDGMRIGEAGAAMLAENQRRLLRMGHYNTAMLHYAGEWYWGVDRLPYLTARLEPLGASRQAAPDAKLVSIRQVMQTTLPVARPTAAGALPPLELFHSFRSPSSYLALSRVFAIADAFGLQLKIRPVLPMLMRNMHLPQSKLLYISRDAAREARRLGVPFGRIRVPSAAGIDRCMAVFHYAVGEKRERDFVRHAGEAIWARGVDLSTDKGMRKATGRTGLFWPDVVDAMRADDWRSTVDGNREALMETGCWGVPTLRIGDFTVWGQDRTWLLARHIEDLCDSGEGILI